MLKVEIKDGVLTISIPVDTLVFSADVAFETQYGMEHGVVISNPTQFAADVLAELEREEEDGATRVTSMLDAAMVAAVENGSEGVEESPSTETEEEVDA